MTFTTYGVNYRGMPGRQTYSRVKQRGGIEIIATYTMQYYSNLDLTGLPAPYVDHLLAHLVPETGESQVIQYSLDFGPNENSFMPLGWKAFGSSVLTLDVHSDRLNVSFNNRENTGTLNLYHDNRATGSGF